MATDTTDMTLNEYTHSDLLDLATQEARSILNLSLADAFEMLDRGELAGTAAEGEFRMLKYMLNH